jgi:benzoyl-CoA 2,3-dioxygenase component A
MNQPVKQHLIDPEICIRCHTCEEACTVGAITHDANNVVVDASKCNFCMDCIAPCPTGSIDNWRIVDLPFSLEAQLSWTELPVQADVASGGAGGDAVDDVVAALLAEAHAGAGGAAKAPATASKPSVNLFSASRPAIATVQGNYRLTSETADSDVRHIILDLGGTVFPVLEGQTVGVIPPGVDSEGRRHKMRLYSISSPRDGERPATNNLSLTVKREPQGVASNYICDLKKGDKVELAGPYGATFLLPDDASTNVIMICTGTGSAPFRGFTMRRQRTTGQSAQPSAGMTLFFGARSPQALPYFGPLGKVPETLLTKHFAFSRVAGEPKHYVQDQMRLQAPAMAEALGQPETHIYVCGLKAMEAGVEQAFEDIARGAGLIWKSIRDAMRDEGRYHVETY